VRIGPIVLATRNPGKIREIRQVLADSPACSPADHLAGGRVEVAGLEEFGGIPEPAEHGLTFAQNARDKALYYAAATGRLCLADDSGLEVDALGGAPGVHSARYAADRCHAGADRATIDAANNAKLLKALEGADDDRRAARFVCHLALADARRILIAAFDTMEGRIGREARGSNGFGYDPLFFIPAMGCTTAELPTDRKNRISHRGRAVRHFAELLKGLLLETP